IHLIREAKENLQLSLKQQSAPQLQLGNSHYDLTKLIEASVPYQFGQWLTREYFYLLNASDNTTALKYIYSWIPAIERLAFAEQHTGEDGQLYSFDAAAHGQVSGENYKKLLFLLRVGQGQPQELNAFLEAVISVKKALIKSGDIGGAIFIS